MQEPVQFTGDLTVEHIMPVKWRSTWSPPIARNVATESEPAEDRRDRLLHTFGNLTLLTRELNSSVSNGPYAEKRSEIANQSLIRLNHWFREQTTWNEDEIERRGSALFDFATSIWPHPKQSR
jgi:hypothetical protein